MQPRVILVHMSRCSTPFLVCAGGTAWGPCWREGGASGAARGRKEGLVSCRGGRRVHAARARVNASARPYVERFGRAPRYRALSKRCVCGARGMGDATVRPALLCDGPGGVLSCRMHASFCSALRLDFIHPHVCKRSRHSLSHVREQEARSGHSARHLEPSSARAVRHGPTPHVLLASPHSSDAHEREKRQQLTCRSGAELSRSTHQHRQQQRTCTSLSIQPYTAIDHRTRVPHYTTYRGTPYCSHTLPVSGYQPTAPSRSAGGMYTAGSTVAVGAVISSDSGGCCTVGRGEAGVAAVSCAHGAGFGRRTHATRNTG
jgi:hypothetical protein